MKILQLCNKLPYPEKDGGAIAINTLTHSLINAGFTVKMLAMNTKKHFINIDSIPLQFRKDTSLETVSVDTNVKASKALIALLTGKSYNISRFYSDDYKNKLLSILKADKFDIIQLEGLYLAPYIAYLRQAASAPIILRAHNVEWEIWDRLAKEEKNGIKKMYLSHLASTLKTYEQRAINLCDGITVFTQNDKQKFIEMGCKVPIEISPFGININKYLPVKTGNKSSLFFIGALDWMPNLQGLDWFLKEVWPKVHASFPNTEFHVAGRNMPDSLKSTSYPNVIFHGEVDDAVSFIQKYNIQIIPLFAGSGIRVKIIEGMALQKAIITTSQGIKGIDCKYGEDILAADAPEDFYNAIKKCLEDFTLAERIADNARKYVEKEHNITTITEKLLLFYKDIISKKGS